MHFTEVTIPGGFARAGSWGRSLWARTLCGGDEIFLAEEMSQASPAARATALLERTVALECGSVPASREFCRELSAGDREALLLHLRRLTFGDRMSCVLQCPSCTEKLDLDLSVTSLFVPSYADCAPDREEFISGDGEGRYRVRFRRINGGDLEDLSETVRQDSDVAELSAIERCVIDARDSEGRPAASLPVDALRRLAPLLAEMDPQAELILEAECPACGENFSQTLDALQYLQAEMVQSLDRLYGEIHQLASHYHWSEAEILSVPAERRRRYLAMIAGAGRTL